MWEVDKNESLHNILGGIKMFFHNISLFLNKYKKKSRYMIPVAAIVIVYSVFLGYKIYVKMADLESQNYALKNLTNYNINTLKLNNITKKSVKWMKTIDDVILYSSQLRDEASRYQNYLYDLQVPYTYLMQNVFLPSLNVWKDPYLWTISTDLIGIKFLKNNPYDDIVLLWKRSDFFKYVGDNNETNDIKNISVWDVEETNDGYFKVPISVSFVANSKRAFLLLVDKLSLTSNEWNVSLINEFLYNLWLVIEEDDKNIKKVTQKFSDKYENFSGVFVENGVVNQDKLIWFSLYQRVFDGQENMFINKDVLLKVVQKLAVCDEKEQDMCLYQYREKYRSVPRLAYLFNVWYSWDPVENFRLFIKNLPPVLKIKSFSFDKMKWQQITNGENIKYEGSVEIDIYGRWIPDSDVDDVALLLWERCFKKSLLLSPEASVNLIDEVISTDSVISNIGSDQWGSLWELKELIETLATKYLQKTNYQKIVSLFEMYRMLFDGNLCEV